MRKVRRLPRPDRAGRPVAPEELAGAGKPSAEWEMMLRFRHRLDDAWFEELIKGQELKGKKITPSRLRRLLIAAIKRYQKEF